MRQVRFSPGPFLDQYEDGHPPEKESEEERRRYRSGLPSKMDLENTTIDASRFEEAYQQMLSRYECQQNSRPSFNKENTFLMGPVRMNDDLLEGESIPASDYTYHVYKTSDKGRNNAKECFVIDISAVSAFSEKTIPSTRNASKTQQIWLTCWGTRTAEMTSHGSTYQSYWTIPLYVKYVVAGALITGAVLLFTNL